MAHKFDREMTQDERRRFMRSVGKQYAMHGSGLFVIYPDALTAFARASRFPYYKCLNFTAADFEWFEWGYNHITAKLHGVRLEKQAAEDTIKSILAGINLQAASYVYDKDVPAPYRYDLPCLGCGEMHENCKCRQFKATPNPDFDFWVGGSGEEKKFIEMVRESVPTGRTK